MRRLPFVILFLVLALAIPRSASAWGFEAHMFIVARAIQLLPPEIRPFFEKYETTIVEHAVDPDLWRTAGWLEEPPRHFLDMDAYGAFPFLDLPHAYDEAVKRHGKPFVEKNGTLPWRVEELYPKLVDAFAQKAGYARDNIKFFSSVLAHYTADAHVPFHAVVNYDGQLTGQLGMHARFESELFERYRTTLRITPRPVLSVPSAREFIFETLLASFPLAQTVLDADRAAVEGRDEYDDRYFTLLFAKVGPILEKRLSDSITDVASIITAAWVEAGRPAVPLVVPATPRKVRRQ